MTNVHKGHFEPGIYVKGDQQRYAQSKADAVALVFRGFKPRDGLTAATASDAESNEQTGTPAEDGGVSFWDEQTESPNFHEDNE